METLLPGSRHILSVHSHSLGILIEWKRDRSVPGILYQVYSHSLGILIEWKPRQMFLDLAKTGLLNSHSLGILIEWKLLTIKQLRRHP